MECNKEEAIRAKELAEKKFLETDIASANRLALKAQNLYPNLDGLSQLLATLEVYVSAENRINGEVDWYKVLGVEPLADDETIRRRYKKLALILHPDKNKSVGADGAFKLLSQACKLLSDKAQNRKQILPGIYEETSNWKSSVSVSHNGFFDFFSNGNGRPSEPASQNVFFDFFSTGNWKDRTVDHPDPTPTSPLSLKPTFWTMCSACKTRFEYQRIYINCNLVCAVCRQHFFSIEVSPAPIYNDSVSSSRISLMQRQKFKSARVERSSHVSGRMPASATNSSEQIFGSGPFSMPGGIYGVSTSLSSISESDSALGLSDQLKRRREDSMSTIPPTMKEVHFGKIQDAKPNADGSAFQSSCVGSDSVMKADRPRKKRHIYERRVDIDRREMETEMASQNEGISCGNLETGRVNAAGFSKRDGMRDTSQVQIRNMLIEKARKEIRSKLKEWNVSSESRNLDKSKNTDKEAKEEDKERSRNCIQSGSEEFQKFSEAMGKRPNSADFDVCTSEASGSLSMSVPDPDFHDFDKDRTEKSFGGNQVWAVYDDDDGMPRYYALIHGIISLKPFKLRISWLNSKSNDELAPIKWVSSGFPKTTGDFRIGKHVSNGSLNSFSHRIKSTKGLRGTIHVYPKKGDVWALYRNWSLDWNELTPDEIIHKYDMVEVLEDYNEERGVNVAPLVKISGFKTVFRRHADPRKVRSIPREEMFRLSHQVPSYLLTGREGPNAPRGCLELDPAAIPMELLQVVTEAPKEETVLTVDNSVENIAREVVAETIEKKETRLENMIVYKRKRVRQRDSSKMASHS
ncbi:hypothetical protein L6164_010935 [Bauhinia variegata]|uniref:Uncharacterized protein n=1 Tax=Bauhinia variegata TaxID=167791 RepID=A0ACB9P5J1_BAUVA|nr:hypothetical protein L6164_010935 [Bauhinia variegata]